MCTLTVHRDVSELLVTMNRDEALTRAPELPPRLHEPESAPPWFAPHDGEKGGTWMGANATGVVACLLNAYQPGESLLPDTSRELPSRGEIIPQVLEKGGMNDAITWLLNEFDPAPYPSFTLLVISSETTQRLTWLRNQEFDAQPIDQEWMVISSSGWDSRDVITWREREFERWLEEGCEMIGTLPSFNLLQVEGNEEASPLMKRPWSSTRSVTQVSIALNEQRVHLRYWPQPEPTSKEPAAQLSLPLIALPYPS